jgi:hypothetical protein
MPTPLIGSRPTPRPSGNRPTSHGVAARPPTIARRLLADNIGVVGRPGAEDGKTTFLNASDLDVQTNTRPLRSTQHHQRDRAARKVLLIAHVLVGGDKHVKAGAFRFGQQVFVTLCPRRNKAIPRGVTWSKRISIRLRGFCTGREAGARLRAANSSTALICSRDTSNCSTISSIDAPASMFSKTAEAGIRVPRNTHAPLSLPGTLSTAGHSDQSRVAIAQLISRGSITVRRLRHYAGVSRYRTIYQ